MEINKEKQGEFFILAEALLWSLFPVIVILSLNDLAPLASLAWSTLFAAVFFALALTVRKKWHELKEGSVFKHILLSAIILGVVYYFLFFTGLKYTSAGNASIVALTEIFFSYLVFNVWKKDCMSRIHVCGAILMVCGAGIIFSSNFETFHLGDILILLASMITPFGNFFQREARKKVSSESILFIRSILSFPVVFLLAYIFTDYSMIFPKHATFVYLVIVGFLLLGLSKIFWVEAIHRINVAKAGALSSLSPLLTLFFAWIFLGNSPTKFQLLAFLPMFFGVVLLSRNQVGGK